MPIQILSTSSDIITTKRQQSSPLQSINEELHNHDDDQNQEYDFLQLTNELFEKNLYDSILSTASAATTVIGLTGPDISIFEKNPMANLKSDTQPNEPKDEFWKAEFVKDQKSKISKKGAVSTQNGGESLIIFKQKMK